MTRAYRARRRTFEMTNDEWAVWVAGCAFAGQRGGFRLELSRVPGLRKVGDVARVAQLDRASASGAEGCGFDPRLAHHSTTR